MCSRRGELGGPDKSTAFSLSKEKCTESVTSNESNKKCRLDFCLSCDREKQDYASAFFFFFFFLSDSDPVTLVAVLSLGPIVDVLLTSSGLIPPTALTAPTLIPFSSTFDS